eukprot:2851209-Pleurochrysis_carterae.AAC.2
MEGTKLVLDKLSTSGSISIAKPLLTCSTLVRPTPEVPNKLASPLVQKCRRETLCTPARDHGQSRQLRTQPNTCFCLSTHA